MLKGSVLYVWFDILFFLTKKALNYFVFRKIPGIICNSCHVTLVDSYCGRLGTKNKYLLPKAASNRLAIFHFFFQNQSFDLNKDYFEVFFLCVSIALTLPVNLFYYSNTNQNTRFENLEWKQHLFIFYKTTNVGL